jgi:hypothetical protein
LAHWTREKVDLPLSHGLYRSEIEMNADNWIAHLQHPLVLAGFGLFVFALVIRPLFSSSSKLSSAATERILHRGMILLFILAIIAILAGVMLSWKTKDSINPPPEFHPSIGNPPEKLQNKSNAELSSLAEKKKITIDKYVNNSDGTITDMKNRYTVEQCFAEAAQLDGKRVQVRGKAVKFSPEIMGRNWIHLQDGSGSAMKNTHDLVVTTSETVDKDAVIVVEGVLAKDKDFGAGYRYHTIIENAKIIK